jgi:D-amino-acid dehydrogenase
VRHFKARGGTYLRAEARGFEFGPEGPTHVLTDQGPVAFGQVVLSAGAWSAPLAAELGTRVPLQAERGYHAMFPNPGLSLRVALMSADRYVAVTGMEPGVRVTGVAEFAPVEAPPEDAYVDVIVRQAKGLLPRLDATIGSRWLGARPSCPDSKPVLGRSPRHANAWFAFGHDHIGLALGGITGKLMGELMAGRVPSVDLAPFRPDRF